MDRRLNSRPLFPTRHGSRFPIYGLISLLLVVLGNASPLPKSTRDPAPPQPTLVAVVSGDGE
jgi:hypothetical protein